MDDHTEGDTTDQFAGESELLRSVASRGVQQDNEDWECQSVVDTALDVQEKADPA